MSIAQIAERLLRDGKLVLRPSSFLGISARNMILLPDIDAKAMRPFPDTDDGDRYAALSAFLDAFSELNRLTVSQDPDRKPQDVMLARVHPVAAEFWSMRITDPEGTPGVRLIGAFCDIDSFVGVVCEFRETMKPFSNEVDQAREIWKDYFGELDPHSGRKLSDYLTNFYEY